MKKKRLTNILIGISAVLFITGMFLSQPLEIKIFSPVVGFIILFGLRFARIKLEPKKLHLMWALAAADIILFNGLITDYFFLSFLGVGFIYVYAPLIGQYLGLNDVEGVMDWCGTITDEGDFIGEDRYYERNSFVSLPMFILAISYMILVIVSLKA